MNNKSFMQRGYHRNQDNRGYYPQQRNHANYGNQRNNGQHRKHSGAKLTKYTPETGNNAGREMYLVTGWKLNRSKELIKFKATLTQKSELTEKGWFGSVAVTLTNIVTGEQHFHWGTMQKNTGKVVVQDICLVANPKARNGGYCGTFIQS